MFATADERIRNRKCADRVLIDWLRDRSPIAAMRALQAAGVPAGAMLRLPELLTDPHLLARGAFSDLKHNFLAANLPATTRVGHFSSITDPPMRQAPLAGEQTRDICRNVLGMTDVEIDGLLRKGVLQVPSVEPRPN
jgi:crotonobetainyl-CoA:carnitine CoA-transferase CaiB-like acyl-CoA transferase